MATDLSVTKGLSAEQLKAATDEVARLKQEQSDALFRSGGVKQFVDSAKRSLLFQPDWNWNDMISGAPLSISIMGSIFIASSVPLAQRITVTPPTNGFTDISTFGDGHGEMSLQACLVSIANLGNKAFSLASTNMDTINQNSANIITDIITIAKLLGDPESAETLMQPTTQSLLAKAKDCADKSRGISGAYQKWLNATREVHAACCQTSTNNAEKERANEIHLSAAQIQLKSSEETLAAAKESMETLKKSLEHAEEQYKKAADEFPTGWQLVAQELVHDLASVATSALKQAVPALISNFTTMGKMKEGMNLFKGDKGGTKDKDGEDTEVDHSKVKPAKDAPTPDAPVLPEDYQDIAYNIIRSAYGHIETLLNLLTAKEGSIDWETITTLDPQKMSAGISITKVLLEGDLNALGKKPNDKPPTKKLKEILGQCIPITKELDTYTGASMASKEKPTPEVVKKWQETVRKAYIDATVLWETSSHIPGPAPPAPPGEKKETEDDGSKFRSQVVNMATTRLNTTAAVVQSAQTNYQESSKQWTSAISALGNIQAELAKIDADKISLGEIRALLVKCIALLVKLQNQINKLTAFFDAIAVIIGVAVENQVEPFLQKLKNVTDKPLVLGQYNLASFVKVVFYNSILNIRCYFSLFQELAEVYNKIHAKFFREGLEILGDMQALSDDRVHGVKDMETKQVKLNTWTNTSLPEIKDLLDKRQKEITANLETDAAKAAKDIGRLPALQPEIKQLVDQASKTSTEIAKTGIQASSAYVANTIKTPVE